MNGEQLTLLPEESLASLSVWPGSREARQMTVTSGRKLLESLPSCDRRLWWLKTLVASSAWRSTMCLLTWHHKVTKQGRSYFQLRASVPRISERESGLLRSPSAQEAGGIPPELLVDKDGNPPAHFNQRLYHKETGRVVQMGLQARVRVEGMWPTPRASEVEMRSYRRTPSQEAGKHGLYLQAEVLHAERLFPTPDAGMMQGGRKLPEGTSPTGMTPDGKKRQVGLTNAVKMLPTPRASDCHHEGIDAGIRHKEKWGSQTLATTARVSSQSTAKLNPAWVSRMMGFPDGWMDVGEATP